MEKFFQKRFFIFFFIFALVISVRGEDNKGFLQSEKEIYLEWIKNNKILLYSEPEGKLLIVDTINKTSKELIKDVKRFMVSPDGTKIAYVVSKKEKEEIWMTDINGEQNKQLLEGESILYCVWSDDGGKLSCATLTDKNQVRVYVIRIETGEMVLIYSE